MRKEVKNNLKESIYCMSLGWNNKFVPILLIWSNIWSFVTFSFFYKFEILKIQSSRKIERSIQNSENFFKITNISQFCF